MGRSVFGWGDIHRICVGLYGDVCVDTQTALQMAAVGADRCFHAANPVDKRTPNASAAYGLGDR